MCTYKYINVIHMHSETPACVFTTSTHTLFVSLALSVLLSRNLSLSVSLSLSLILSLYLCMNSQTSHVCTHTRIYTHTHTHAHTFLFFSRPRSLCISVFLSVFFCLPTSRCFHCYRKPQFLSYTTTPTHCNILQHTATHCTATGPPVLTYIKRRLCVYVRVCVYMKWDIFIRKKMYEKGTNVFMCVYVHIWNETYIYEPICIRYRDKCVCVRVCVCTYMKWDVLIWNNMYWIQGQMCACACVYFHKTRRIYMKQYVSITGNTK